MPAAVTQERLICFQKRWKKKCAMTLSDIDRSELRDVKLATIETTNTEGLCIRILEDDCERKDASIHQSSRKVCFHQRNGHSQRRRQTCRRVRKFTVLSKQTRTTVLLTVTGMEMDAVMEAIRCTQLQTMFDAVFRWCQKVER
jgi:hypothetical protein